MIPFFKHTTFSMIFLVSLTGCGKIKKTDAEFQREEWVAGMNDSIEYYKDRNEKITVTLDDLNRSIGQQLDNFEKIKNPREVEGYYLLKGWRSKIPMTSTGIYARINENEKIELIATLAGATFNQIEVESANADKYISEYVRHDQALNFRHERFNTVYFQGGKADTIAQNIAEGNSNKVILNFLENGNVKKTFVIPEEEKNMIRQTWDLYYTQKEAHKLQKELWLSSKKIDAFRRIIQENSLETDKNSQ